MIEVSELLDAVAELIREQDIKHEARTVSLEQEIKTLTEEGRDRDEALKALEVEVSKASDEIPGTLSVIEETVENLTRKHESHSTTLDQALSSIRDLQATDSAGEADSYKLLTDQVVKDVSGLKDDLNKSIQEVKDQITTLSADAANGDDELETDLLMKLDTMQKDFNQKIADQQQNTLEAHAKGLDLLRDEVTKTVKELQNELETVSSDVANRDFENELETRVLLKLDDAQKTLTKTLEDQRRSFESTFAHHMEVIDALRAEAAQGLEAINLETEQSVSVVADRVQELAESSEAQVKDLKLSHEEVVKQALKTLTDWRSEATAWLRGGEGYKQFAVARHGGALWQATQATKQEPGSGADWVLLADGLNDVDVQCDEQGYLSFTARMASGKTNTVERVFRLPVPRPCGVHNADKTYSRYDAVVFDGHTFLALVDNPGGIGKKEGEWLCIGHRGKAGRGAKAAPTAEEVAAEVRPQLVKELQPELADMVAIVVDNHMSA